MNEKDNFTDVVDSLTEQPTIEQDAQIISEEQQVINSEGEIVTLGNPDDVIEK